MAAYLPDIESFIAAGIDPKTGLPVRFSDATQLKTNIKKLIRIQDEQDHIQSFNWYNLPEGLDGDLIERILYYRGQAMFFYMRENNTFYFLPYALDGTIDVYGRFTGVTPVPFNGTASADKDGKPKAWITGLKRTPVYSVKLDLEEKDLYDSCVLLSDYSKQISQTNIPRQQLQEPLIDVMADCVPFLRTALLNATGVQGMRVSSQDEYANVEACSRAIDNAALTGKKYVPVVGNVDFQDLTSGTAGKGEEFLMAMQGLDNLRLAFHGLDSGGIFQKKSHMLQSEQDMNAGNIGLVFQNKLSLRQNFCDIVNSIWGLGISCEPSECVSGADMNMDGMIGDEQDQSGTMQGEQPAMEVENE